VLDLEQIFGFLACDGVDSTLLYCIKGGTKMVLAIDIGNTNTNIGLFDEKGRLSFLSELETDKKKTQDQCCLDLLGVFRLYQAEIEKVTGAILSSVVPPMTGNMTAAVTRLTGHKPLVVGPGLKTGMNIKADVHNQLGSDIVASSVAAFSKYETPIVVINFGTAVTFSYLSDNSYEGCAIMPGIRVALEALSEQAAQLPHISLDGTATPLGRNTVDAMRAGVMFGNAGAIDRMIDSMEEAAGVDAKTIVAIGGEVKELLRHCTHRIRLDQNLLMDGLFQLYQKNGVSHRKNK
jgi:type III pantothenate kinase